MDQPTPLDRLPEAELHTSRARHFQVIWLIPVIAALIAVWLGWRSYENEGPTIVITFNTADGVTAGQTQVRHKAVPLGTVRRISLTKDLGSVEIAVAMRSEADSMLTENAHFWVVRPRLAAGNISGLDTVLSGSYIEMDPGPPGAPRKTRFAGLEEPPAVRSGEPGTAFTVTAQRIGSLGSGAPIFYRDIPAGEVLNYDLGPNGDGVTIHAFVRSPFDKFVHRDTRFWNASGIAVDLGAQGVQLRVTSLQAALSGGIAFDTMDSQDTRPVMPGQKFSLYPDEAAARAAGYRDHLKFLVYFDGSVRGLAVGAPAELDGIQVGSVTGIDLQFPTNGDLPRVAVRLDVEPERFLPESQIHLEDTFRITTGLVHRGMRARLESANLLTGQMLVSFDFVQDAPAAEVTREGDRYVIPGTSGGGLDSVTASLSQVAAKLDALPLDKLTQNLNDALHGIATLVNGPDIRETLGSVNGAAKRLPAVAQHIDQTLAGTDRLVASANAGYGQDSQFRRDITRLLDQLGDAARSIRLLADYLDAHPEALIRGRTARDLPP